MNAISGIIRIIRPLNGVVAAATLLPALALASGDLLYDWHAGIVLFLLVSYGYVVNDIYDVHGDAENGHTRPLAAEQLTTTAAWILSSVVAVSALIVSAYHSSELLIYASALVVALYLYAAYISTILVVANLWVAAMCASVFYLPLLLSDFPAGNTTCMMLAYGALLSFLYHFGREIVKDVEDMRGDIVLRRATLPLVLGAKTSRKVAAIVFLLMIAVSYFVYYQRPGTVYLWIVTLCVNLPIALIFLIYLRHDPIIWAGRVSAALKVIMLPALAALLALGVASS